MQALANGHNTRGLWEAHCIQSSQLSGTNIQSRVGCDHFHDISTMKSWEAAAYIRKLALNVLVDLNGHTPGASRMDILSFQPSPIQISFLGWPSTTGADYLQYYIADPISVPLETASQEFTEKVIFLPHSFMFGAHPNFAKFDEKQYIRPTRAMESLPENAFVFCNHGIRLPLIESRLSDSFHFTPGNLAKIDATIMKVWLDILDSVPNSVLWLRATRDTINHIAKVFQDKGYPREVLEKLAY